MLKVFHIISKDEWNKVKNAGVYTPASLKTDGFIHCSKADQILTVANSFYKNSHNLILLRINTKKLNSELKI